MDAGDGWLIFKSAPAELYLMCDDLETTMAELTARGVEFTSEVNDAGWGRLTTLAVPGAGELGRYEPRHPVVHGLP